MLMEYDSPEASRWQRQATGKSGCRTEGSGAVKTQVSAIVERLLNAIWNPVDFSRERSRAIRSVFAGGFTAATSIDSRTVSEIWGYS
jgi:hypothetical protein